MASLKQVNFAHSLGIKATLATPSKILKVQISNALRDREHDNEQIISDIKARANLLDYVKVPLSTVGQVKQGCCPFHVEKTPSFTVYDDGSWYCFGACQEGGDVFSFIMKQYNLSFAEALAELARDTGVPLGSDVSGRVELTPVVPVVVPKQYREPKKRKWRDPVWQSHARREAEQAHRRLMDRTSDYVGEVAVYLASRALDRITWEEYKLGQLMSTRWCNKSKQRIAVGNAVSIPWFGPDGTVKAINHRVINGEQRFNQKAGSWRGLYGTHLLKPSQDKILIAVEGEFNCASIRQVVRLNNLPIDCTSFGSQSSSEFIVSALSHLRGKYRALVIWADKPEATRAFQSDLALSSVKGDANDLLINGLLGGLLERVSVIKAPEPEPYEVAPPPPITDKATATDELFERSGENMKMPQLVPSWLKLQYPLTEYVQDAYRGYWWDITASELTTGERAMAVSLWWRWQALNNQNERFAGLIPDKRIRVYTINQIKRAKSTAKEDRCSTLDCYLGSQE